MNLNEKISGKQVAFFLFVAVIILYWIVKLGSFLSESPRNVSQPVTPPTTASSASPPATPVKPETEKEYKKSCILVSGTDDGKNIYYKDFLKNPKKYTDTRLNIQAKIMSIEESDNQTAIQVYLTRNFDTGIVYFDGIMKIYEGDIIRIYGEGAGVFEGQNRMGASMSVPFIKAKYIKKERSED